MNTRPDFESIKDFEEFSKYYWYREELIKICKKLGLKADGGKIELNKVIEAYFSGEKILPVKKNAARVSIEKKSIHMRCWKNSLTFVICMTVTLMFAEWVRTTFLQKVR